MMKNSLGRCLLPVVLCCGFAGAGVADDVVDSINEGLEYYNNGEFAEAASSLNYAVQLIQQKKGDALTQMFPQPLEGWEASDPESQSAGAGMFGGGVTAERAYSRGDSHIVIRVVTDSPMLQSVMMMFSNPMFATSGGGKLERVGKQKAVVKYAAADKSGDLQMVVDNRFLVTVEGDNVAREDLLAYAAAVDVKKLAEMP